MIVTGLVPYKKQLEEYRNKFLTAASSDPAQDVPKYWGFFVQKAEVVPGAKEEPKWSKSTFVGAKDMADAINRVSGKTQAEPADPRFILPPLTSPLPLLADVSWGNEAVYPPQIPVVEHAAEAAAEAAAGAGALGAQPRQTGGPPPVRGADATPPQPGLPPVAGSGPLGPGDNPAGGGPAKADNAGAVNDSLAPEYLLLRYIDFDIKPDKQYQYRVFPVLVNPNYNLEATVLDDRDTRKDPLIHILNNAPDPKYAKLWSDAGISDRVPGEMRLLCGTVLAASGVNEIKAEIRVLLWREQTGRNSNSSNAGMVRGSILNFKDATLKTPGGSKITQDLATNSILVDLQGGETLPDRERTKSPGLILVMDDAGNLVLHDEAVENEEWDKATKEPEKPPEPAPAVEAPAAAEGTTTPAERPQIAPVPTRPRGGR